MIKEEDRIDKVREDRANKVAWLKDLIKASARYERLLTSKDFSDCLEDMKRLRDIHQDQINGYMMQMEGTSFFKRMRLVDTVMTHQIRMNQLTEAINYPEKLMDNAIAARESLRLITEEDKKHATN